MQLKCITGPCDGIYVEVRSDLRVHDYWQIQQKSELLKYNPNIELETCITIPVYTYKMELFRGPKGEELKFLIPVETDSWDFFVKRILHGK